MDTCLPAKYVGKQYQECYSNCPVTCGMNEMKCSGDVDPHTGNNTLLQIHNAEGIQDF